MIYCYALVLKTTGSLLLKDGRLPIYWLRRIAEEEAVNFPNCQVKRINLKDLKNLIQP